jgi:protein-L-isoaspartate(D-aspartate) O-methyltransferase
LSRAAMGLSLLFATLLGLACGRGPSRERAGGNDGDAARRARMVETQIVARGVRDVRVLAAMREVPRHLFVDAAHQARAYDDQPLPIDRNQTVSQPYIVALMTELLDVQPNEKVLEIGTGSGYSSAVLARLAAEVITIERHAELAQDAAARLKELGLTNVEVVVGDGSRGLPERAPFEAIAVHATAPEPPISLLEQLAPGGRLVVPVASRSADMLTQYRRRDGEIVTNVIGPARFVPLIGEEGFSP